MSVMALREDDFHTATNLLEKGQIETLNCVIKTLFPKGSREHVYPYVHYAIYVGKLGGKHYVVENNGFDMDTRPWGKVKLNGERGQ